MTSCMANLRCLIAWLNACFYRRAIPTSAKGYNIVRRYGNEDYPHGIIHLLKQNIKRMSAEYFMRPSRIFQ